MTRNRFELERRGMKLVPLLLALAAMVGGVMVYMQSALGPDGLLTHVNEYNGLLEKHSPGNQSASLSATGPAVVVNYDYARLDDLMNDLPKNLQAEKHSEVRTVVIITRQSTGLGGGGGIAPVMKASGSYTISAYLFDLDGGLIAAQSISKKSAIVGAGAEAELRAQADPEMAEWIVGQFGS